MRRLAWPTLLLFPLRDQKEIFIPERPLPLQLHKPIDSVTPANFDIAHPVSPTCSALTECTYCSWVGFGIINSNISSFIIQLISSCYMDWVNQIFSNVCKFSLKVAKYKVTNRPIQANQPLTTAIPLKRPHNPQKTSRQSQIRFRHRIQALGQ